MTTDHPPSAQAQDVPPWSKQRVNLDSLVSDNGTPNVLGDCDPDLFDTLLDFKTESDECPAREAGAARAEAGGPPRRARALREVGALVPQALAEPEGALAPGAQARVAAEARVPAARGAVRVLDLAAARPALVVAAPVDEGAAQVLGALLVGRRRLPRHAAVPAARPARAQAPVAHGYRHEQHGGAAAIALHGGGDAPARELEEDVAVLRVRDGLARGARAQEQAAARVAAPLPPPAARPRPAPHLQRRQLRRLQADARGHDRGIGRPLRVRARLHLRPGPPPSPRSP
ncbi:hypothetical protein FIBSPDRAFT_1038381 [Athelia psychrophila]|uniref:Uncharacterized protein n=1 Tax=Athelia psychrophila TaxID=1759441 RepID=A0A166TB13_9AGAM|nr:hypothetical protein FIBSPDRAFT_1038381 [Fibularhizoctonia sp. CBS 109695]